MSNKNLHKANKAKNDEFYTQLSDIEKELKHYIHHFKDKIIYCNCDKPDNSNFWSYFSFNFELFDFKKLIASYYDTENPSFKFERVKDDENIIKTQLTSNGDFRSLECIEILKEADIIVTNGPFSLFREYLAQLIEYDKKFLIIGNLNAVTYKETFKLIKENKVWLGATMFNGGAAYFIGSPELYDPKKMSNPKHAYIKDGKLYWRVNGVRWFTNLEHKKRHEELPLHRTYNEKDYPKYDNYDAIEVSKTKNIPMDYEGAMGVPISFLDKFNPNQFEIVKFRKGDDDKDLSINGKCPYFRIIIKNKNPQIKGFYESTRMVRIREK